MRENGRVRHHRESKAPSLSTAGQTGGRALLKKQALRQIEQTIRDIEEILESDEELTPAVQAELTYLSWHFIASLSRWKRRHGRPMDAAAEYPAPR